MRLPTTALSACALVAGLLAGCASAPTSAPEPAAPSISVNRPDGEGYAGTGELLVRIGLQPQGTSLVGNLLPHRHGAERASIEIRYVGLDSLGRAVFERRDSDVLAESAPPARATATGALTSDPPNVRQIALDLRMARQLRVQGKIVEIIEAAPSGVVFRLY